MVKNIIYVQQNEEIAKAIINGITSSGYEVFHCTSAGEALNLMTRQDSPLLMLDINIPDMRLREVVKRCADEFPATVLAVFTDYPNLELLTKLINRHGIYKIFVAPWDTASIIEQIEDAMEYAEIRAEKLRKEQILNKNSEDFDLQLKTLTDSLKYQQHAYYKISSVVDILLNSSLIGLTGKLTEDMKDAAYRYTNEMVGFLIKAQTTGQIPIETFEELMTEELKLFKNVKVLTVESCMFGEVPRVKVANVRFIIMMIVAYYSKCADRCEVQVLSSYLTNTKIYMELRAIFAPDTDVEKLISNRPLLEAAKLTTEQVLGELALSAEREITGNMMKYKLEIPTSFA